MSKSTETPWAQTNLGAGIVGGVVVLIIGAIGNTVLDGMPAWLRWVVSAASVLVGLILVSAINRTWRNRIWVSFGSWIAGLRPVSTARLRREVAAEREAADKEHAEMLEARRRSPSPPSWLIRHDRRMGRDEFDNDTFWLTNMGFPVTEVEVTGDPAFIVLPHRVIFPSHDNGVGQWFAGNITERGRQEGVTLAITWRNRHGDPGSFEYRLEPEAIADMGLETRDQAYSRGRADGFAEGRAEGVVVGRATLQAEVDAKRARPVRQPSWLVGRKPNAPSNQWILVNSVEGAVATEVFLFGDSDFTATSAADWPDLTGVNSGEFRGIARMEDIVFRIEWNDANGERQGGTFHYRAADGGFGTF